MELHIPTIFVMLVAGCITFAVSALAASERHAGDGLREWGLALCIHATSYILFALRGTIPDFLSIVCANTFFSLSYTVFYYAVHVFLGVHPKHRVLFWGPPLVTTIGVFVFFDSVIFRVLLVNAVLALQGFLVQKALLSYKFDFSVRGRNLIIFGIALSIFTLAWKFCIAIIAPDQIMSIFLNTPVQVTLYLVTFIALIMVSTGFALMAKERSDAALRKAALLDRLTGCWNRVRIEEILQQEMARMHRYGHPVTLLMLDLDNFKHINDQYGHLAGDEVLRDFGRLLRTNIRATDVPGRWGGEEFVIVLPSSTFFDAVTLAEHIRKHLETLKFYFGASVTVSIGVAACRAADTVEEWMQRADMALYKAKISGRNQVRVEDLDGSISNFICSPSSALRLQWSETYECGHEEIDQQHRNLFATVNNLLQLDSSGADKNAIGAAVKILLAETVEHFQFEEHILNQIGYPDAPSHVQAHHRLLDRANILLAQFQRDGADLAALLRFMIYELTAQHIMIDDRCFGKLDAAASGAPTPPSPAVHG